MAAAIAWLLTADHRQGRRPPSSNAPARAWGNSSTWAPWNAERPVNSGPLVACTTWGRETAVGNCSASLPPHVLLPLRAAWVCIEAPATIWNKEGRLLPPRGRLPFSMSRPGRLLRAGRTLRAGGGDRRAGAALARPARRRRRGRPTWKRPGSRLPGCRLRAGSRGQAAEGPRGLGRLTARAAADPRGPFAFGGTSSFPTGRRLDWVSTPRRVLAELEGPRTDPHPRIDL